MASGDVWEQVAHRHKTTADFTGAVLLPLHHIDQAEAAGEDLPSPSMQTMLVARPRANACRPSALKPL